MAICRSCIGWLNEQSGGLAVTPTLPVVDLGEAIAFYESIGFEMQTHGNGDGFAFAHYEGQSTFDLDRTDVEPGSNCAGCYIVTQDVDAWHERVVAAGISATDVADMEWGMREFSLRDPSGNNIRIGRPL
jgi:predicted enzyme related to lactoylglutathione lyase